MTKCILRYINYNYETLEHECCFCGEKTNRGLSFAISHILKKHKKDIEKERGE